MRNLDEAGIRGFVGGRRGNTSVSAQRGLSGPTGLLALVALIAALLAGSLLALAPVRADGLPDDIQLVLSIDDSDGTVAPDSEFSVSAALRFTGPHTPWQRLSIADAALRLSGPLSWQAADSGAQRPSDQFVMGGALYRPFSGGFLLERYDIPDGEIASDFSNVVALSLHHRTLLVGSGVWYDHQRMLPERLLRGREQVAEHSEPGCVLYVFDTWNKRQAALVKWPDTYDPNAGACFGRGGRWDRGSAVWHESETIAWLFISAAFVDVDGADNLGNLYIYKLDWSQDPPSIELAQHLVPPQSEFSNMRDTVDVHYSSAVAVSADGGTLAVAAQRMNNIGAVYVYTRPDGEGEDWGDIEYADGVKLSAAPAPAWGASGTRPFDPDVLADCDAYCSRVSSLVEDGDAYFGRSKIGLSSDGRVLAVPAYGKRYPFNQAGGAFDGGMEEVGEVYVFVAPEGGWAAVPEASGTLIEAGEDASSFDPDLHYSPGPARRITAPSAVLLARPWADAVADREFGDEITVSADGSTIAVGEVGTSSVHIFQRASASDWAGELLPSATLDGFDSGYGGLGSIEFVNRDASVLLGGNPTYMVDGLLLGAVDFFMRPSSGTWVDTDTPTIERLLDVIPEDQALFGQHLVMGLDYERLAISHPNGTSPPPPGSGPPDGSGVYLSDGNCAVRIVDAVSTRTCPIAFEGKVVIPADAEEGVQMISAQVTLSVSGMADSEVVLREAIEVTIGEPPQLAELRLGFATNTRHTTNTDDDAPFPSVIAAGETTTLQLQLLDERGVPWDGDGASALRVTTTAGALSAKFGGGCAGGALARGRSCSIDAATLSSADAGAILLDLRHSGRAAAAAQVQATFFSAEGGETLNSAPLTVILTGPPAALAVAAPAGGLLNIGTPDEGDDRDMLTLAVTALDEAGNPVAMPAGAPFAMLTGPDGERVTDGVEFEWPLGGADTPTLSADGRRQVRININRAADQPLANGEYTLEVRAGAIKATQTLNISGGPAAIALSPATVEIDPNSEFTLTATLTDAEGAAVPNGTLVEWSEIAPPGAAGVVQLRRDSATTDGQASATWRAVMPGAVTLTAASGGATASGSVTAVAMVTVAAPPPPSLAESLTATSPGAFAVWTRAESIRASDLLPALEGVTTLSIWRNGRWLRYGVVAGQLLYGSRDFTILHADTLWLSAESAG